MQIHQFADANRDYVESLYNAYLQDRFAVSAEWQNLFANLPATGSVSFTNESITDAKSQAIITQLKINDLINAYKNKGYLIARTNPLDENPPEILELTANYYGLDLSLVVAPNKNLYELIQELKATYCGALSLEFMHITNQEELNFLTEKMEEYGKKVLDATERVKILNDLIAAEGLEKYLGAKYPGAKRFSIEGVDALIVLLNALIEKSSRLNYEEIGLAMAHRGRLNVLVNVLGKAPKNLFAEFEGQNDNKLASGDVKYHQGFSTDIKTSTGNIHLSLAFNPSHLEIVGPALMGAVKAKQIMLKEHAWKVLPVVIHGDAAFAGQGVVMESLNMAYTRGYGIGGTLHVVLNNQIGFTISNPQDARSTARCTDIGKMLLAPIFHVNANYPEQVLAAINIALLYRHKFNKDVIVDLIGYRRHGHNEADEPMVTQPVMYKKIKQMPTALKIYSDLLVQNKVLSIEALEQQIEGYRTSLVNKESVVGNLNTYQRGYAPNWIQYQNNDWRYKVSHGLTQENIKQLGQKLITIPSDFVVHNRVEKIIHDRAKMLNEEVSLDWGCAESLAFAVLLAKGFNVRLSGQDSGRGTFFHRHSVMHHQQTGATHIPLTGISQNNYFTVIDSFLSEEAVLAFEYGFAATEPRTLVLWEAQFGDFANGAQVVIDQFISSGEQKWGKYCGITLLLPHGYEGQGPEHSSARLERYLQLCAEHNMQVCVPSTPAQIFHVLVRQMLRPMRKPLIILTPKSLLRHELAISPLSELVNNQFMPVLPEIDAIEKSLVKKVIFCSGKIYYELLIARRNKKINHIAIIRIEQLYPWPKEEISELLALYPNSEQIVWCQEEPQNQGAWDYIDVLLLNCINEKQQLLFAGRAKSAAPAAGSSKLHNKQQQELIDEALR